MFGHITRSAVLLLQLACLCACEGDAEHGQLDAALATRADGAAPTKVDAAADARPHETKPSMKAVPTETSMMSAPSKKAARSAAAAEDADAGAPDPSDVKDERGCAVVLAPCISRLQQLKQACAVTGAACQTSTNGTDKFERCYSNGVHVTLEIKDPGQVTTIFKADGSVCMRIEARFPILTTYATAFDPEGHPILTIASREGFDYESIQCDSAYADVPMGRGVCGDIELGPSILACDEGSCASR